MHKAMPNMHLPIPDMHPWPYIPPNWAAFYLCIEVALLLSGYLGLWLTRHDKSASLVSSKRLSTSYLLLGSLLVCPFFLMQLNANLFDPKLAPGMWTVSVLYAGLLGEMFKSSEKIKILYAYGAIEIIVGILLGYYSAAAKTRDYTLENMLGIFAAAYVTREGFGVVHGAHRSSKNPIHGKP